MTDTTYQVWMLAVVVLLTGWVVVGLSLILETLKRISVQLTELSNHVGKLEDTVREIKYRSTPSTRE